MEHSDESPHWLESAQKGLHRLPISRIIRWALYLLAAVLIYQNWYASLPLEQLQKQYAFADSHFIEVDGMPVHCRITGNGEPIILLHDANNSLHTWESWTAELSKHYRVISVDLPGFGLTGPHPRGSYSTFMYANFLETLTQTLQLEQFNLVGNGLGAQIAWFYTTEYPGKVRKLILLDAPGFEGKNTTAFSFLARTPVLNRVFWHLTPKSFIRLYLEDRFTDDSRVTPALVQRHFDLLLRPGNRKALTDRAQVSENRPPVDIVSEIEIPTLILWGAEDTQISPEYAYEFHRRIRTGFLKIYQNTGHWPQEENPGETVQDVLAFLEGKF